MFNCCRESTVDGPLPWLSVTGNTIGMVSVLATGGTMSCTADARGDLVPTRRVAGLLEDAGVDGSDVSARDVLQLDSSTMGLGELDILLSDVRSALSTGGPVVVTHGTDSLEETAMAVDRLIGGAVVLTGAQRPADDSSAAGPDGPANLRAAIDAATDIDSPCVVFGGKTLPAYGVRKIHTTADAAFATPAIPRPPVLTDRPAPLAGLRVDIIAACQGCDPDAVDAAVSAGARGIVIAAFGSGNIGALAPAVRRAVGSGVPVVVSSRVAAGGVQLVYGGTGGGRSLAREGVRSAGELTPAQARMELLCELAVERAVSQDSSTGPRH